MKLNNSHEVNFDGLVGPTHNYSGLSFGNIASVKHKASVSNPREAALQGLAKMKTLLDLGLRQAVLPPHERPNIAMLRGLGFSGDEACVIREASQKAPEIFTSVCSASAMWTANAAIVTPSQDTADRKVHFTPANLNNKFHRSFEHQTTSRVLKEIFSDPQHFVHHPALAQGPWLGDEGAANHTRLCLDHAAKGVHFFVFGKYAFRAGEEPKKFPARQTFEASQAVARLHGIKEEQVVYGQQNPAIIDEGVFHNDVAAMGNEELYLYHENAYENSESLMNELKRKFLSITGSELKLICVPEKTVQVKDAVSSYLFNSQLVSLPSGKMAVIAPENCRESSSVKAFLESLEKDPSIPVSQIRYFDLRQSMSNGGGPACLRLRIVLTETEYGKAHSGCYLSEKRYHELTQWVKKHYRDRLSPDDLADPKLLIEVRTALDELTQILSLKSIYSFQN